ncbi:MAG: SusC/RagA family TonB-linked outer membrane protein [Prevotellaceae bacterium]|jgi:iron complex outermembrane receptor protein|nr:SusC/RagA family TonB-linked outer membrane protein [Prevotellaceae bacterium]
MDKKLLDLFRAGMAASVPAPAVGGKLRRMRRLMLSWLLCALLPLSLGAQSLNVSGTVLDGNSEPVVGASVVVKGSTVGVTTDANGGYTISAPANATLVFSFLGMSTREEAVDGRGRVDVTLSERASAVDEVVVTALGIRRDTRALGYAIGSVRGEEFVRAGINANPLASLYGKTAGVGIQATAAGPTGGVQIKIRNASSLDGSSFLRPLFVVDGVPIYDQESSMASRDYDPLRSFDYGSGVNDISPEDIESMEILKGAKASVLYGSAGANGVVLITTKSGRGTKGLAVNVSYSHEWEQPYSPIDFQNEYGSGENEYDVRMVDGKRHTNTSRYNFGPKFDGSDIVFFDGTTRKYQAYEDNYMALFRTGHSDNLNVSVSGGNERSSARLSYTSYGYNGTMSNQTQEKNALSFNGMLKATELTTFEFSQNLYMVNTQNRRQNLQQMVAYGTFNRDVDIAAAKDAYLDENGFMRTKQSLQDEGWQSAFTQQNGLFDMLWNQNQNRNIDEKLHSITSAKANFQLQPFLTLRLQAGIDYTVTDFTRKDKVLRQDAATGKWEGGRFSYATEQNMIQQYEAVLNFNKEFVDNKLKVDAFIGPSYKKISYDKVGAGTMEGNFNLPNFWSVSNTASWPSSYDERVASYKREGEALYSVFGQATFSWMNKYYFEVSARNDWASTLPQQNRSFFYPGASFTWNFNEDFEVPELNFGKLRLSWADVGRPATRYYALRTYTVNALPQPYPGVNDITGPEDLFSGDLMPERKREMEAGFDVRFFRHDRIGLDFAYYYTTFYNQIMAVPLSSTTGASKIRMNAGEVNNQGLEFMLKVKPVVAEKYEWNLNLSVTKQWDKVVKLYPGITEINTAVSGVIQRSAEGERMGQLYTRDYARAENGEKLVNANGLYYISTSDKDMINVGNINPDWYGGLGSNFSVRGDWGAVNFAFGIDYRIGGSILSYSNFYLKGNGLSESSLQYRDEAHGGLTYTDDMGRTRHDGLILPGVKSDGTPNDVTVSAMSYYNTFIHDMSSGWQPDEIKENSFVKFRELSLSYTLPQKWTQPVKVQRLSVALTARNLFYIWKNIENIDPEAVLGTDSWVENSTYPSARMYGFNVNISF